MNSFNLEFLRNEFTCFQSENASCMDLFLTSRKELFKHLEVIQVGIPNHHSFIVVSLKSQLVRGNAKSKIYRDCSKFNMDAFKDDLNKSLSNRNVYEYKHFQNIFVHTFNKHATIKK